MTVWVLHCWALDVPDGVAIWVFDTLDEAVEAALAYLDGVRFSMPELRDVYSIAETEGAEVKL